MDPTGDSPSDRTPDGRFKPGHRPTRPRSPSLTKALRRATDVDAVAAWVAGVAEGSVEASPKMRQWACDLVFDRLEGKAIARSLSMHGNVAGLLPALDHLSLAERERAVDDLISRARSGDLALDVGDDDDEA
jgi:hypothetical protein